MCPRVGHIVHRVVIDIRDFAAAIHHRVRARTFRQCHILSAIRDGGHRVVQCLGHTMHDLGIVNRRGELAGHQHVRVRPHGVVARAVSVRKLEHHAARAIRIDIGCAVRKRDGNRMAAHILYLGRCRAVYIGYARHFLTITCRNRSNGLRKGNMVRVRPRMIVVCAIRVCIGIYHITFASDGA